MNAETRTIEKLRSDDIPAVSRIFHVELKGSFGSSLGMGYLTKLYFPYLLAYPGTVALVAKVDGVPAGFILGAKMTGFYGDMIKGRFFQFLWFNLLCFVKNPIATVREIINIFRVSNDDPEVGNKEKVAELLYMAVDANFQRRNLGASLVEKFEEELRKIGYERCLVQTMENTPHSQNFYRKNNFAECQRSNGRVWFIKNLI